MAYDDQYYTTEFGERRKKKIVFSDIDATFAADETTRDLKRVTNEEAIKISMGNLIRTKYGERKFQRTLGCEVYNALFELMSPIVSINIQKSIETVIYNHEKRVDLKNVTVTEDYDKNGYIITIEYFIVGQIKKSTFEYFLERIR